MMKNYRIKIENKFDFDFIKKYLIDNNIGGKLVCVGTYLPDAEELKSLEYDETFKEWGIIPYSQELIHEYIKCQNNPDLWDKNGVMICINQEKDIEMGDVCQDVKPISVSDFLSLEKY